MENQTLIKLDQAKQLLAEVNSVKDVLPIIKQAELAELYAKKVKLGEEAEMYARSIKFAAQRKAGEFLKETPKHKGGDAGTMRALAQETPTLAKMGITKKQSSNWQQMTEIPEESFELVKQGKKTIKQAKQEVKREKRIEKARTLSDTVNVTLGEDWDMLDT
ncbi:MAG: hypothetical protein ABIH76_00765 [Candidatus Bathyarchaeota archaeon]